MKSFVLLFRGAGFLSNQGRRRKEEHGQKHGGPAGNNEPSPAFEHNAQRRENERAHEDEYGLERREVDPFFEIGGDLGNQGQVRRDDRAVEGQVNEKEYKQVDGVAPVHVVDGRREQQEEHERERQNPKPHERDAAAPS